MVFDPFNYDIKSKMPIWWSEDTFLEPINRYSQELLRDLVYALLNKIGLPIPIALWKTLPTEYSWLHTYTAYDKLLKNQEGAPTSTFLNANTPIFAEIPNSKRNRHGVIHIQLNGDYRGGNKPIKKFKIKNAHQTITINNIDTMTDIKIYTEDQRILIDGVQRNDLVTGKFNKIYSQAKNTNYNEVDIDDENKITYIELESTTDVNFDLQIKHIHPIYVTEQNIRIYSISAFPIESIKLYGFYCHDFNDKQEWRFLWEKKYELEDRVTYDRITTQFNCETFYIEMKFHGIDAPVKYGFPQENLPDNSIFEINTHLDKWGAILGLPRRYYKTNITDDEEPNTYPPFYKYEVEQDYWYEQRLTNEYKHNEDAINATYIKDTNLNNIALLQCISPFVEDIYVYTESILPTTNNKKEIGCINPTYIAETGDGITWQNPHQMSYNNYVGAEIQLYPKTSKYFNNKEYQTKILELHFSEIPELPKNIKITGLELKLSGLTDIHSESLKLDDRSNMLLPIIDTDADHKVIINTEKIPISSDMQYWKKEQGIYNIGGKNNLFGQEQITKEQIEDGLIFELGFTNENTFLKALMVLYNIQLFIYYEIIEEKYTINARLSSQEIVLNDINKQSVQLKIDLNNIGKIPVINQNIYIAVPPELEITNKTFPTFDLDVGEPFTIGEKDMDRIILTCPQQITGKYDIIIFCNDKVIKKEITVRSGLND